MKPGQWAVVRGKFPHTAELFRIDAVTDHQIHNNGRFKRIALRSHVLKAFDNYADAQALVHRVEIIRAEVVRRQLAATTYGDRAIARLL